METQQHPPLFSQGGYKDISYPKSSSCHVRSWNFLKSTIFLRITCSTLCQHTQHSQQTCLPTLFNNPCYSLEAQNSEAQRSKTFTYLHSSTVVSPILEIKIREFRQGWEFEKEKEPRPPAHRKFREGKENRFQVLAPLRISNPGIQDLFVKVPRYYTLHTSDNTAVVTERYLWTDKVEGHKHAHRAHRGFIPCLYSVPSQKLLQEAESVQQPGKCQQQLPTTR